MDITSVYPQVVDIVADVLAIEKTDITPESSLINDLGAESIDFLDLVFRLERGFNVKIPRGQIEKEARGSLSDAEFEQNGVITPGGISALKAFLSEVPEQQFKANLKTSEIPTLFTVTTLCKLVLNAQAKQKQVVTETSDSVA
jgi:acyl carrier protein